eukprot:scaffold100_cov122-Isochrysis_galbana.AAC.4
MGARSARTSREQGAGSGCWRRRHKKKSHKRLCRRYCRMAPRYRCIMSYLNCMLYDSCNTQDAHICIWARSCRQAAGRGARSVKSSRLGCSAAGSGARSGDLALGARCRGGLAGWRPRHTQVPGGPV